MLEKYMPLLQKILSKFDPNILAASPYFWGAVIFVFIYSVIRRYAFLTVLDLTIAVIVVIKVYFLSETELTGIIKPFMMLGLIGVAGALGAYFIFVRD